MKKKVMACAVPQRSRAVGAIVTVLLVAMLAVVVAILDGAFTLKRLMRDQRGLHLEAANPAYPCLDLRHCTDVQIWGVAVHVIHPL